MREHVFRLLSDRAKPLVGGARERREGIELNLFAVLRDRESFGIQLEVIRLISFSSHTFRNH